MELLQLYKNSYESLDPILILFFFLILAGWSNAASSLFRASGFEQSGICASIVITYLLTHNCFERVRY